MILDDCTITQVGTIQAKTPRRNTNRTEFRARALARQKSRGKVRKVLAVPRRTICTQAGARERKAFPRDRVLGLFAAQFSADVFGMLPGA